MIETFKKLRRERRARRIRAKVSGTAERPRLSVFKSNTRLTAQVIDDEKNVTLASVSSADVKAGQLKNQIDEMAQKLAADLQKKGVTKVVFDRGGFLYAGNIRAFADAVRKEGIAF